MTDCILYIHGMGGGGDSRIPSILREALRGRAEVVVRTYDFDPETAASQIAAWVDELKPAVVAGESLGAVHALRIKGVPHVFVSPSLNAPLVFGKLAWLALIPGVTEFLDRIYRPKEGDRQKLHFTFRTLRKYSAHRAAALENSVLNGGTDRFYAFFGTHDHYRRSGIVSVRTWKRYFGETFQMYEGSHFMEENFIHEMLVPKIISFLDTVSDLPQES
ncbi:MAG: alpha/beta hydrolase [Bacteroidales bacterium]|nr:alpha/beta hydrolase [Bacteroidales bacterium]